MKSLGRCLSRSQMMPFLHWILMRRKWWWTVKLEGIHLPHTGTYEISIYSIAIELFFPNTLITLHHIVFFSWFINGTEVDAEADYRYNFIDGTFIITNASEITDFGRYQCRAENSFGTILSRDALLQFACEYACYLPISISQFCIHPLIAWQLHWHEAPQDCYGTDIHLRGLWVPLACREKSGAAEMTLLRCQWSTSSSSSLWLKIDLFGCRGK